MVGFLDPATDWGQLHDPEVVEYEALEGIRCLVILGEGGIGKSHLVRDRRAARATPGEYYKDLRTVEQGRGLAEALFDGPEIKEWRDGDGDLELWIDSIDEYQLRVPNVGDVLADLLRQQPRERLKIRLLCRASEWPPRLGTALREFWPGQYRRYTLAPLRRVDAHYAAESLGLDGDAFLNAVQDREVGALAARPISLRFLLGQFTDNQELPSTRRQIYEMGLHHLAAENRENVARTPEAVSAEQRLVVAGRVAALTTLSSRPVIWTGREFEGPPEALRIGEIAGGKETAAGNQFDVFEFVVKRTLDSGLFASAGPDQVTWSHLSYSEFLGARHLARAKLTLRQRKQIFQPGPTGRIPSGVAECAAWLTTLDPQFFSGEVIENDPMTLLRGDLGDVGDGEVEDLLDAIFARTQDGRIAEFPWSGGFTCGS